MRTWESEGGRRKTVGFGRKQKYVKSGDVNTIVCLTA